MNYKIHKFKIHKEVIEKKNKNKKQNLLHIRAVGPALQPKPQMYGILDLWALYNKFVENGSKS